MKVDIEGVKVDKGYDDSNILALPSKKRESETVVQKTKIPKKLTKKERRKLEKVIEQKEKKAKVSILTANIFECLNCIKDI